MKNRTVVWTGGLETDTKAALEKMGYRVDDETDWRYHAGRGDAMRYGRFLLGAVRMLEPAVLVVNKGYRPDGWTIRQGDLSPILDAGIAIAILDDEPDQAIAWHLVPSGLAQTCDLLALGVSPESQKLFRRNTNAEVVDYPRDPQAVDAVLRQAVVIRARTPPPSCCLTSLRERLQ